MFLEIFISFFGILIILLVFFLGDEKNDFSPVQDRSESNFKNTFTSQISRFFFFTRIIIIIFFMLILFILSTNKFSK